MHFSSRTRRFRSHRAATAAFALIVATGPGCSKKDSKSGGDPSADAARALSAAEAAPPPNQATLDGAPVLFRRATVTRASRGAALIVTLSTEDGGCEPRPSDKKPALEVHLTLAPVIRREAAARWTLTHASTSGAGLAVAAASRKHDAVEASVDGDAARGATVTLSRAALDVAPAAVGAPKQELLLAGAYRLEGCGASPSVASEDGEPPALAPVAQPGLTFSVGGVPQEIVSALWKPDKEGRGDLLLSTLPRTCSAREAGADVWYDVRVDAGRATGATLGGALVNFAPHTFARKADAPVFRAAPEKDGSVVVTARAAYEHPQAGVTDGLPMKIEGTIVATVCRKTYP